MPCLYKMEVKQSQIQGKGFFSMEDIPKGVVYWVWEDPKGPIPVKGYQLQQNVAYTKEELENMEDKDKLTKILHGGFYYADGDLYIDLKDGTEFTNHSEDWNSQIIYDESKDYRKMTCVTRKAVKAGDQITGYYGNYLSNQKEWVNEMITKYVPLRKVIEIEVQKGGNKSNNWKIE